ncbi:MAG: hypothetical protein U9N76_04955 [Candidatus Marinimicrobia bacterium]|nr:hypothetical protein [Candidatus Neomarinimicrobiota bacterium]
MKKIYVIVALIIPILFLQNCDSTSGEINGINEQELITMLESDSSIILDGYGDSEVGGDSIEINQSLSKMTTQRHGLRYGKFIDTVITEYDILELSEDSVIVTINRTVEGFFRVLYPDTTTADSFFVVNKPFTITSVRKAECILEEVNDTTLWKVNRLSMISGGTANNSFTINSLKIETILDSTIVDFNDPTELSITTGVNFPTFGFRKPHKIFVDITIDKDCITLLQNGRGRFQKQRYPLWDKGFGNDEVADDGIFSGIFITAFRGRSRCFVDVMPISVITDPEAVVEIEFWGFPYRVRR